MINKEQFERLLRNLEGNPEPWMHKEQVIAMLKNAAGLIPQITTPMSDEEFMKQEPW